MLKNYLKVVWRNIKRHTSLDFGLFAAAMGIALLVAPNYNFFC